MNKPTAPEQIKVIAQEIQEPISKYRKENAPRLEEAGGPLGSYRQRHTRSQGDYIGLMPPDMPKKSRLQKQAQDSSEVRKVKISSQVKVRTGSHDSLKMPPSNGQTVRGTMDGGKSKRVNVRNAHAGEAAGGLLMMRQVEGDSFVQKKEVLKTSSSSSKLADAFKRRMF